jgi:transcription termination factor Rho
MTQMTEMNIAELQDKTRDELVAIVKECGLANERARGRAPEALRQDELLNLVLEGYANQQGHLLASGVLDLMSDGYGFLRQSGRRPGQNDVYVSQTQVRRFGLRTGDLVLGQVRAAKEGERFFGMTRVETVNGLDPDLARRRPKFEDLTPIFPDKQITLETNKDQLATRLIDLLSPVGRGQRGLIVSPPKAGKTTLLKQIAHGITANYEDIHLMVALIGERPEEVTDVKRSVQGEVYSSTFDEPVEDHCRVAELALERAKRLVEGGRDVVILLDSITRLTRAYNLNVPSSGRTLSGGMDPVALYPPKRFFGAARNTEEGGSLTILAACLVDTGSRMDDVVYEEFKGTGNMELHLDRKLSERRTFPAIDIQRSGTRREELLLSDLALRQVYLLRRMSSMIASDSTHSAEATERVIERMSRTKNNEEFLATLTKEV